MRTIQEIIEVVKNELIEKCKNNDKIKKDD